MQTNGIYFGKENFYNLIRSLGGTWNDSKERPIICLVESLEHSGLYWAIPMGNWNHRDEAAQNRIEKYMNYNSKDIRSCFYHVGNTDVKSIFFISDVVPITNKYIEREYLSVKSKRIYVVKNKPLLKELNKKLSRILSWENDHPNSFRQHITAIKEYLVNELEEDRKSIAKTEEDKEPTATDEAAATKIE